MIFSVNVNVAITVFDIYVVDVWDVFLVND